MKQIAIFLWYSISNKLPRKIAQGLSLTAIFSIKTYQYIFSAHRKLPRCKYFPSCSGYAILAVEKDGLLLGISKALWRIIRCNPFSKGGLDLP